MVQGFCALAKLGESYVSMDTFLVGQGGNKMNEKINWEDFEFRRHTETLKLEPNVEYTLGFQGLEQRAITVKDGENTKVIPALVMKVRHVNGEDLESEKELIVTNKNLVQQIRVYFEAGKIFNTLFRIKRTGSGFQTAYVFTAVV